MIKSVVSRSEFWWAQPTAQPTLLDCVARTPSFVCYVAWGVGFQAGSLPHV